MPGPGVVERAAIASLTAMAALTACGDGSSGSSTTEVLSVEVTTTIAGFTPGGSQAMPIVPGAAATTPEDALAAVSAAIEATDTSVISTGPCGTFAMAVTTAEVFFMSWDGKKWNDQSALLQGGRGFEPRRVISRDYTGDDVIEFLVVYVDAELDPAIENGLSYGAVFGYPLARDLRCQWTWLDIDNGREVVTTFDGPDVPLGKSYVNGYGWRGDYRAFGKIEYDPDLERFVFTRVKLGS